MLLSFALRIIALAACATVPPSPAPAPAAPVEVQIIGINDFHGNIEPPADADRGRWRRSDGLGGAAFLARKVQSLRSAGLPTITVSAGDLIGAQPADLGLFPRRADHHRD